MKLRSWGSRAATIANPLNRQLDHGLSILLRSISFGGNWVAGLLPFSNGVVNRTPAGCHLFGHRELMVMHGAFEKKNDQNVWIGSGSNEPAQPAAVFST